MTLISEGYLGPSWYWLSRYWNDHYWHNTSDLPSSPLLIAPGYLGPSRYWVSRYWNDNYWHDTSVLPSSPLLITPGYLGPSRYWLSRYLNDWYWHNTSTSSIVPLLIAPGYLGPSRYWVSRYWNDNYWHDGGTGDAEGRLIYISAAQYVSGKLRQSLTDFNAAHRSSNYGNWVYPDKPLIAKLINDKNNFPRISVEPAGEYSDHRLGQMSEDYMDKVTLRITAWTVRDLVCDVVNVVGEGHIFYTGTVEYSLTELPVSSIGALSGTVGGNPYTFIQGTDYALIDADGDGFRDTVDWLLAGTNPDDGTVFSVTYSRKASGPELARLLIQSIHSYIRRNWRLNWNEHILFNYRRIGSQPNSLDAQIGVYSHELTVQFDGINIGETISCV